MNILIDFLGLVGGLLLSICAVPLAWRSLRTKETDGISWTFIALWGFGEIFMLIYGIVNVLPGLIINTIVNTVAAIIITGVKFKYGRS